MRARLRPDLAVLSVRGDDARVWLNGQVTNDVRQTKPGDAVHALVLNVKGRILADAIVVDRGERGLAAIIPASEHAALREHLEKYVIMEDVELVLESLAIATLHGEGTIEGERFATPWLGTDASIWIGEPAALVSLSRIDDDEAERERFREGRGAFGVDFGPTTYPQEAGLEGAVSFQKGCYLGQEVVCMLENRGQLSRKLVRLETDHAVTPGAKVLDESGADVGAITSATSTTEGRGIALAYVKRTALAEERVLRVDGANASIHR